jgi:prefoldin subunit 5
MKMTTMQERLVQLRQELERGQQQMALLDQRKQELRDTVLRITGAIQVLEELQEHAASTDRPVLATTA